MKKRAGFTLIELVIGIAIMLIIFGGIVYIFGASSKSAMAGMNHKQAYESARNFMDEIKTTMRYADTINLSSSGDTLTYAVTYDSAKVHPFYEEHFSKDIANGKACYYDYTITWKDSNKTQLKVVRNITPVGTDNQTPDTSKKATKTFYFPEDNYVGSNGAFTSTQYYALGDKYKTFPIIEKDLTNSGTTVYNIAIPIQYKDATGTNKVDILQTEVQSTKYDAYDNANPSSTYGSLQEAVIAAVTSVNANDVAALLKDGNNSQQYIPRISSGGMYQDLPNNTAEKTAADAIKKFLTDAGVFGAGKLVDNQVWLLEPILSSNQKTLLGWYLYVGKNVINDVGGAANADDAAIAKAQGEKGVYYIRRNYGFLTYRFKTDAAGNFDSAEGGTDGLLGYATGTSYEDETNRVIFSPSWIVKEGRNYLEEYTKINTYMEDYHYKNGKKTSYQSKKVTHYRIDYDGTGEEYIFTKYSGSKYHYPPNGPTDTTGNGSGN
jgi:prepilin-type N-terminal cleavage/methylation domain-containing protein